MDAPPPILSLPLSPAEAAESRGVCVTILASTSEGAPRLGFWLPASGRGGSYVSTVNGEEEFITNRLPDFTSVAEALLLIEPLMKELVNLGNTEKALPEFVRGVIEHLQQENKEMVKSGVMPPSECLQLLKGWNLLSPEEQQTVKCVEVESGKVERVIYATTEGLPLEGPLETSDCPNPECAIPSPNSFSKGCLVCASLWADYGM